ncbi:MAG: C10 family peptidase [Tannerellaceae bacterium]|nr:C10 family peptidase [Tannerellaceae bacterium]
MRKHLLLLFILLLMPFAAMAQNRSETDAMAIAKSFLSKKGGLLRSSTGQMNDLRLAYTAKSQLRSTAGNVYFYVFNRGTNDGFILVSADGRTKDILGYADEGTFDFNKLPDNFKYWLEFYESEFASLDNPQAGTALRSGAPQDGRTQMKEVPTGPFSPYITPLVKTRWNQDAPYWNSCPTIGGKSAYTGCVATAMAQIMYFHKHPAQGTSSHSYTPANVGSAVSANFGATTYQWDNMLERYSASATSVQQQAVATLMFHCGVAVDMDYGTEDHGGSGAYSNDVPSALENYFGYDSGMAYLDRRYYSYSNWVNFVKDELTKHRPVYYSGSGSGGGHAFVCDGYNEEGFFHFNWGWGGSSDGYFELSALNPSSLGIGGGAGGYNSGQAIITGIQPSVGGVSAGASIGFASVASSISSGTHNINTALTLTLRSVVNIGTKPFNGYFGYALYQNNSLYSYWIKEQVTEDDDLLLPGWGWNSYSWSDKKLPTSLPDGEYTIVPVYSHSTDENTPIPMQGREGGVHYLNVTVSSSGQQFTIGEATPKTPSLTIAELQTVAQLYLGKTASFTAKVTNSGTGDYNAQLRLRFGTVGTVTEPVVIPVGATKTVGFSFTIPTTVSTVITHAVQVQYDSSYGLTSSPTYVNLGGSIDVTVNAAPAAASLSLVSGPTFANSSSVNKENPQMTVSINNTGGLFDEQLLAFVFPSSGGTSLTYFGRQQVLIDNNETKSVLFNTPIDLEPGAYGAAVYFYNPSGGWTKLGNTVPFTLVNPPSDPVALSLAAATPIYNGSPQAGFNFTNPGGNVVNLTAGTDYTVTYVGRNQTTYSSATPPTNAGDYRATVALQSSLAGYMLSQTTVDFSIQRRTLSDATVDPIAAIVYSGNPQTPASITVKIGSTTLTNNTDYSFAATNGGVNAGTATLTITGQGNYKDTKTTTYTISKRQLAFANVAAQDKVYDGTTAAGITSSLNNIVAGDDVSLNFIASFANANVGTAKDVTVQSLALAGIKSTNYLAPNIPTGLSANITVASYTYNITQPIQVFVGSAISTVQIPLPTGVSINGTPETIQGTGVWYSDAAANTQVAAGYTFAAVGTATLYYKFTASVGNYNVTPQIISVAFNVLNGNGLPQSISFETASPINKIFGDPVFTNAARNNTVGGSTQFTYRSEDTNIATVNATTGAVSILKVGTVHIYAKAAAVAGQFVETESSYVLNIASRELTSNNTQVQIAGTYIYTGASQLPTANNVHATVTLNGVATALINAADYTYSLTGGGTNAGNAIVTVSGTGNYSGTVTGSFNIAKLQLTGTATASTKVYDGTTSASVSISLSNVIGSDDVTATATGTFASKDAGTAKQVVISNVVLSGNAKDNYSEPVIASTTANITTANYTYPFTIAQHTVIDGATLSSAVASIAPAGGEGVNTITGNGKEMVAGTLKWFSDAGRTNEVGGTYAFTISSPQVTLYWKFTATDGNYTTTPVTGQVIFDVQDGLTQDISFPSATLAKEFGTANFSFVAINSTSNGGGINYLTSDPAVAIISNAGLVEIRGVGTTTLTAVAAQVPGFFARTEAYCVLTVTPKSIADAEIDIAGTLTYNGTAQMPASANVAVKLNGETLVYSTDYTINSANTGTDAGEYVLTITGTGNYKDDATQTFTIERKPITIDLPSTQVDSKTYDNTTAATVSSVGFNALEGSQSLVINTDYSVVSATFDDANAGTHDVDVSISLFANGPTARNYSLANGAFTKTAAISKATTTGLTQLLEVKAELAQAYNFDLTTLLPSVTGVLGNEDYSVVSTTDVDNIIVPGSTINGTAVLSIPVISVEAGKTATIDVEVSSDNYNNFISTIEVKTIAKTPVTISGLTVNNKVYDGQDYAYSGTPVIVNTVDGSDVTGITLDKLYESVALGYSSADAPRNAGDYTLKLSVPTADATYSGSIVYNFSIEKKPVKVKANDVAVEVGQPQPTYSYTIDGQVGIETVLNGTPSLTSPDYVDAAGVYTIVPSLAGVTTTDNYVFDTPSTVNGTLTVVAAGGLVTGVTLNTGNLTLYVGNTSNLVANVQPITASDRTVTWTSSNTAIATVTSAGLVRGIAPGTATITVRTNVGGYTATCIVIVRDVEPQVLSSDASLYRLAIVPGTLTPDFSPGENNYSANVGNSAGSVTIEAIANHYAATVTGDGLRALQVGENTIDVMVRAEDGTENIYRIVITRSTGVGTEDVAGKLNIYFDPAYATLFVESDATVKKIAVYDLIGRFQLSEAPNVAGVLSVPIANLGRGVYLLRIETAQGTTTLKFVKKF